MSDGTIRGNAIAQPGPALRIRKRVVLVFMAMGLIACLLAGTLLIIRASSESDVIRHQASARATALSFAFDQEVAAVNYLLKGLSRSPALRSGDLQSLYDQLKTTPVPEGSWLIYQDLEKQLLNTLRPFGSTLPMHTAFPNYQEQIDRIRDRGWTVSGRMYGLVKGAVTVVLSLRLNGPDGQMTNWLTTALSEVRLRALLDEQKVPADWTKGIYDRKLQPLVTAQGPHTSSDIPAPPGFAARVQNAPLQGTSEGMFEDRSEAGEPVLVAYRHSGATNWTAVVQVPLASVEAPLHAALWQIVGLGGLLLLGGGLAAVFTARQIERPFHALSDRLTLSTDQVNALSGQLLALQEEERQRIARELHDSTAQHLVAAHLAMAGLEQEARPTTTGRRMMVEIERLLDTALKELRIFTYLLHPPDLAKDGLQATLRDFTDGFADRTGLAPRIRIPEEIDRIPPDIQWAILRVVQEALANVHRHAAATHVAVDARVTIGRLIVRIRDDGRGMKGKGASDAPIRFGVGIPGMRARLKQFGGDLRIKSGPQGTSVVAIVPLSLVGRASTRAGRLLDAWLPRAAPDRDVVH